LARTVEFRENDLILHLSGFNSLAALKKEIVIPYQSIQSASIKDFEASLMSFKIGTSGFGIREGRFLLADKWCFLSYGNNENVIVLELENHDYKQVVFQITDVESVLEQINSKLDLDSLLQYDKLAPHASRAVPRAEHFVPFFHALGSADPSEDAKLLFQGYDYGSFSFSYTSIEF
jgi:hypothetical protein